MNSLEYEYLQPDSTEKLVYALSNLASLMRDKVLIVALALRGIKKIINSHIKNSLIYFRLQQLDLVSMIELPHDIIPLVDYIEELINLSDQDFESVVLAFSPNTDVCSLLEKPEKYIDLQVIKKILAVPAGPYSYHITKL